MYAIAAHGGIGVSFRSLLQAAKGPLLSLSVERCAIDRPDHLSTGLRTEIGPVGHVRLGQAMRLGSEERSKH